MRSKRRTVPDGRGFVTANGRRRVHVRTAGSRPSGQIDSMVVEVLDEIGVPVVAEFPKPLTDEVVQAADYVITMGCGDACPIYPGRRYWTGRWPTRSGSPWRRYATSVTTSQPA